MKKVTLATVKSFIRKNVNNLTVIVHADYNGMLECLLPKEYAEVKPDPTKLDMTDKHTLGLNSGIWFVGHSSDSITVLPNGYHIYNCCRVFSVIVK